MANRKRFIAGIVLAAVYAFFFASTNFFYHSHIIQNTKVVHSHPWSGHAHSHSADQVSLIEVLDSVVYEESESLSILGLIPAGCQVIEAIPSETAPSSASSFSFSLRAPPAHC